MTCMGIDPSINHPAWGIIEVLRGSKYWAQGWGTIKVPQKRSISLKLSYIVTGLGSVWTRYRLTHVAIEDGFVGKFLQSSWILAQAVGAIKAAAQPYVIFADAKLVCYAPKVIKLAVTGSGGATKQNVRDMLNMHILNIEPETVLTEDESDALAVALACAMRES